MGAVERRAQEGAFMLAVVAVFTILQIFGCAQAHLVFGQEPFYKGKTIRLIVGTDPGGGFDTYSRAIARHISGYNPRFPHDRRGKYARGGAHDFGQLHL